MAGNSFSTLTARRVPTVWIYQRESARDCGPLLPSEHARDLDGRPGAMAAVAYIQPPVALSLLAVASQQKFLSN